MIALVQRVSSASVTANSQTRSINQGYLVFLGITHTDAPADAEKLARKVTSLRLFNDPQGKINLALQDVAGSLLIISQFSLHADTKGNNRPSFTKAAPASIAQPLYDYFVAACLQTKIPLETGFFGEEMQVTLTNDGPLTIIIDSTQL